MKPIILKDEGIGAPFESEKFIKTNLPVLDYIVKIECRLNNKQENHEWAIWNTRLTDISGNQMWLSGCNCGYRGVGPTMMGCIFEYLNWKVNKEIIFTNEEFIITRKQEKKETE
jgi:hypothetical protein